jgi:hypothetical protein
MPHLLSAHPLPEPRDARERDLIDGYLQAVATTWDRTPGPPIRRTGDGKLIRLPDITMPHTYDMQVGREAFVLGRGPGRAHGVISAWLAAARTFDQWPPDEQAAVAHRALHNEDAYRRSLLTNPPAPEDAPKFAGEPRPLPPWAKVRQVLGSADAPPVQHRQPAPAHRFPAPHREGAPMLAAAD